MRKIVMLALLSLVPHAVMAAAEIDILWGTRIPLRDGVRLNTTVFEPRAHDAPLPVIFTLTPYNSDSYYPRARYFAQNGYVYALVDVRGHANSERSFLPFENEGRDSHDVVEWLAAQPCWWTATGALGRRARPTTRESRSRSGRSAATTTTTSTGRCTTTGCTWPTVAPRRKAFPGPRAVGPRRQRARRAAKWAALPLVRRACWTWTACTAAP